MWGYGGHNVIYLLFKVPCFKLKVESAFLTFGFHSVTFEIFKIFHLEGKKCIIKTGEQFFSLSHWHESEMRVEGRKSNLVASVNWSFFFPLLIYFENF